MTRNRKLTLRVAAWNILRSEMGTAEQIAAALAPWRPDIVAFTEVPQGDWTARAAAALGMKHHRCGTLSSGGEQHEWGRNKYKAIVSRYPLGPCSDVYPKQPSDWLNGSATRAVADCNGLAVAIYSLHIPGFVAADSVAEHLGRYIAAKEDEPRVVAMGDYNDLPGSPGLRAFEGFAMRSAYADLAPMTTHSVYPTDPTGRLRIIDHIYYRPADGARAIDGGIIDPPTPLSDHKPVWAVIEFDR